MAKAREAFRTISEVSEWLDTPAHVLRFWESKFSQIKPVKRAGGRRYYRPEDMALLSGIKYLLHEQGMTIKGAQKLLREQGVKYVAELGMAAPPQQGALIEGESQPAAPHPPEEIATPGAVPYTEPAAWDPDDPWPPDPGDAAGEAFDEVAEATPANLPTEPEADEPAPVMPPPPRHEVSLPFARTRAEAAEPPEPQPQPEAEILSFGAPQRPPIPDLPAEDAIAAHPGALTALIGANPDVVRANAARIAPLAGRLKVLADRIAAAGR